MAKNHKLIIRSFLEKQDEELNIRKISKYSKIDYKTTYNIIKDLEKEGIVITKVFGKTKKVMLKKISHPLIFEAEFERRKNFLRNKDFLVLYKNLSELNFPFITLLFGSYVKGTTTKHSDIDLLIICEEKREEKIQEVLDLFPLNIHPTFVSFEDFIKMLKTKEFNVVLEAVKNNIILIGIEDYYRLLENVK
ncbi:MAG: nucleotidyltransferase domain-containing protein [Candidatus Woesearchaeota archaeon]